MPVESDKTSDSLGGSRGEVSEKQESQKGISTPNGVQIPYAKQEVPGSIPGGSSIDSVKLA
jgi:hypothetical protein